MKRAPAECPAIERTPTAMSWSRVDTDLRFRMKGRCCELSGARHPVAEDQRPGLSNRARPGEYSHPRYFHDWPWRYPDDGQGHEGWSGGFPDQAFSRPGYA